MASRIFTGHVPAAYVESADILCGAESGVDVLLTVHDDGRHELATRPGRGERWVTWSPPVVLHAEKVGVE